MPEPQLGNPNDQAPIPNCGRILAGKAIWKLVIGSWDLIGLLLLKFFPPRQDFLVAAVGSAGI
jgi:hypothetical protein